MLRAVEMYCIFQVCWSFLVDHILEKLLGATLLNFLFHWPLCSSTLIIESPVSKKGQKLETRKYSFSLHAKRYRMLLTWLSPQIISVPIGDCPRALGLEILVLFPVLHVVWGE